MKICLWRYKENTRNYPGYHLSADKEGCQRLIEKLTKIRNTETIDLNLPDSEVLSVPNNGGGKATWAAAAHWQIDTKTSYPREHFIFQENHPKVALECSREQIECIIAGVQDIQKGKGDYCIGGPDNHVLWFWWQNEPKRKR